MHPFFLVVLRIKPLISRFFYSVILSEQTFSIAGSSFFLCCFYSLSLPLPLTLIPTLSLTICFLAHTLDQQTMSTSFMNDMVLGPTMYCQSSIVSTIPPLPHFFSQPNRTFAQKSKSQSSPPKLLRRHTQPAIPSLELGTTTEDNDLSINKPSIHHILLNQGPGHYTLDNFAVFLQTQFCSENLAFWLASRQYKV